MDVIPQDARALRQHCESPEVIRNLTDGLKPKANLLHPDAVFGYGSIDGGENGFTSTMQHLCMREHYTLTS